MLVTITPLPALVAVAVTVTVTVTVTVAVAVAVAVAVTVVSLEVVVAGMGSMGIARLPVAITGLQVTMVRTTLLAPVQGGGGLVVTTTAISTVICESSARAIPAAGVRHLLDGPWGELVA